MRGSLQVLLCGKFYLFTPEIIRLPSSFLVYISSFDSLSKYSHFFPYRHTTTTTIRSVSRPKVIISVTLESWA